MRSFFGVWLGWARLIFGWSSMDVGTQTDISWIDKLIELESISAEIEENEESYSSIDSDSNSNCSEVIVESEQMQQSSNLPTILQYLRESNSSNNNTTNIQCSVSPTAAREGIMSCHFCGNMLPNYSLLINKEVEYCCNEFKEYIAQVTLHTKRMHEEKIKERPGKIKIANPVKYKKTVHEKAIEKIRRKQRWEEKQMQQLRMLKSSSIMAMSRQTKVIQFSLSACTNNGWIETAPSTKKQPTKKQRRPNFLSSIDVHNISPVVQSTKLQQIYYSTGNVLCLCLPNNDTQCYYPSGNLAILQMYLHQSIKLYLLYKDEINGGLIGYLDDLGRCCINGTTHSIRFFSDYNKAILFGGQGHTKYWYWKETMSYNLLLPLVFKLEQYISVQFNNEDNIVLMLNTKQKCHKYEIKKIKTKINEIPDKSVQIYQQELEKIKRCFDLHLKSLQQEAKLYISRQKQYLPSIAHHVIKKKHTGSNVTFL